MESGCGGLLKEVEAGWFEGCCRGRMLMRGWLIGMASRSWKGLSARRRLVGEKVGAWTGGSKAGLRFRPLKRVL